MEKVIVAKSRNSDSTVICGTRYGNVMASRGSVIPLFTNQIITDKPITITNSEMTRFMMTLDEAVELVLYAFSNGKPGDIFVQKSPAATIQVLAEALKNLLNKPDHEIKIIGTRHGEKKYEVLLSKEEMAQADDLGGYFRVPPDLRDLNYDKYLDKGETKFDDSEEYNSDNTNRLNVSEMKDLLLKLDTLVEIQNGNLTAKFQE
jgi:UDP-glucose 4-epimerase